MVIPQLSVSNEWNYLGKSPDYAAAIREYSQRDLTDQGDVLLAIDGLLRTLRLDAGRFVAGLPEAHFLQSLLWHPEPGSHHTRANYNLPTWTWASWRREKGIVFGVLDVRLLRLIILTIQNVFISSKRFLSDLLSSSSSDSTSSWHSTSSSSYSSPSSSSSSSSSGRPILPPLVSYEKKDWTTLNAMSKATVNVDLCFGLPLMFRHHTVKHVFLCEDGKAIELACEEPLSFSTFTRDEKKPGSVDDEDSKEKQRSGKAKSCASRKVRRHHKVVAKPIKGPVLSMRTVVVKLSVGACLSPSQPRDDNEASIFELVDSGLIKMLFNCCQVVEEVIGWNSGKHLAGNYGLGKSASLLEKQPSVMSFFNALLTAKNGEPRPKFLWSTVNLLLVERGDKDNIARRIGVDRVIFEAWLFKSSKPEEAMLA
ncbi:hypothetical protein LTR70_005535 [Exophiala xenobiotica]|nr:hypothetical protein LTR70_005535 [Exophiala xenobiotica]